MPDRYRHVDAFLATELLPREPIFEAILEANARAGLPSIDVSPTEGKLLELLVRLRGARRVLEIGTLGGYSGVWMARAMPRGGQLDTLEAVDLHADVAARNFEAAGVADRITIHRGPAIDTLRAFVQRGVEPYDLVFIDADKRSNPDYVALALSLSRVGTLLVIDNVVRSGAVADPTQVNADLEGIRRMFTLIRDEPRLEATALQTVGLKGWDGLALALVVEPR